MVRLVTPRIERSEDRTCVWMGAGLLAYKLCDRGFDCEHCPLDAALRGDACPLHDGVREARVTYPDDRVYGPGHTWLRSGGGRAMRFGIDALAAMLIGPVRGVRRFGGVGCDAGAPVCALELEDGDLTLALPVRGAVSAWNGAVLEDAGRVATEPYEEGWIAEVRVEGDDASGAGGAGLMSGEEASRRMRLDLRRFRRHVGWELLLGSGTAPIDAAGVLDLRRALGGGRFLSIVRELVH